MEAACGSLEIEFRRISNDLLFVTHKIENEFRGLKCPNPLQVSRRLEGLERRMQRVQEKMKQLNELKKAELCLLRSVVYMVPEKRNLSAHQSVADAASETTSCRESLLDLLKPAS